MGNLKGIDIGQPAHAGATLAAGTGWDLTAGGEDIWGPGDQFHFAQTPVTGDFDLVARLEAVEAVHHYTKAGLMAREGLGADAAHVFLLSFPADGARNNNSGMIEAQYRPQVGAGCTALYPPARGVGAPEFPVAFPSVWLRLTRTGSRWTCRVGSDGRTWTVYAEVDLALRSDLAVGLAFTSHDGARSGQARFRDVRFL